jgi:hypothetical protein
MTDDWKGEALIHKRPPPTYNRRNRTSGRQHRKCITPGCASMLSTTSPLYRCKHCASKMAKGLDPAKPYHKEPK